MLKLRKPCLLSQLLTTFGLVKVKALSSLSLTGSRKMLLSVSSENIQESVLLELISCEWNETFADFRPPVLSREKRLQLISSSRLVRGHLMLNNFRAFISSDGVRRGACQSQKLTTFLVTGPGSSRLESPRT